MAPGSTCFRRMTWLALLAVLLGALVPTVSRVVASSSPGTVPLLMEMCTPAGRTMMDVSLLMADRGEPAPPAPSAAMDACAYCVLSPTLPLLLALLITLLLHPAVAPAQRRCFLLPQPPRNLRGLGARAPPVTL